MNRRFFMKLLGLAPVAAAVPAKAHPLYVGRPLHSGGYIAALDPAVRSGHMGLAEAGPMVARVPLTVRVHDHRNWNRPTEFVVPPDANIHDIVVNGKGFDYYPKFDGQDYTFQSDNGVFRRVWPPVPVTLARGRHDRGWPRA